MPHEPTVTDKTRCGCRFVRVQATRHYIFGINHTLSCPKATVGHETNCDAVDACGTRDGACGLDGTVQARRRSNDGIFPRTNLRAPYEHTRKQFRLFSLTYL
jgi:hypothetical protein